MRRTRDRADDVPMEMGFDVIERRPISLLQFWLLQDTLKGDIGTFGLRIEGDEFVADESLAEQVCQVMSPYIEESAARVFKLPTGWQTQGGVSFQGWKPGSYEVQIALQLGSDAFSHGAATFIEASAMYVSFHMALDAFMQDLKRYGPTILEQVRKVLPVAQNPPQHVEPPPLLSRPRSRPRKPRASPSRE